ncbi:MAG: heavy metal transporter [Bacteroidetes bacterium]|nr:MAG: heavy metal transporter [Bacteroidota bacterium]
MKTQNSLPSGRQASNKLLGAGILSAVAASLCCITPVLALIAGSSGIAASFSWLEPARPYLIGITVLVLGFAWYQKLKPKKADEINCDCEPARPGGGEDDLPAGASAKAGKPSFLQSKKFLGLVTIFAAIMLVFPYYSHIFYPETKVNIIIVDPNNIQQASFEISGMTCPGCEEHIKHAIAELPGYIEATANFKEEKATVKFDKSKTDIEKVIEAINETGYTVSDYKIVKTQ